jgi:acyl-CoA thioester hydrolase
MGVDWDYPAPFTQSLVAGTDDIDALGHVNNACYIRWCEAIAWQHSAVLGLDESDYVELRRAMAIHHAEYDYVKACFAGDQIQAGTWITRCDFKLTMERCFQFMVSGETVFRGSWQLICINLDNNKPVRIPGRFIEVYQHAVLSGN